MTPEWLPWPEDPGYHVYRDGRIMGVYGRFLKPVLHKEGYLKVGVRTNPGGPKGVRTVLVHRMVCQTFHGDPPFPGAYVLHGPGANKTDNRAENLRWGTASENMADRLADGHDFYAKKTHCPQGHEYTEENTYRPPGTNGRRCRTCNRDIARSIYRTKHGIPNA